MDLHYTKSEVEGFLDTPPPPSWTRSVALTEDWLALKAGVERFQDALRAAHGGCRLFSEGDSCDCGLCKRDGEIIRLQAIVDILYEWIGQLPIELPPQRPGGNTISDVLKAYVNAEQITEYNRPWLLQHNTTLS